MICILIWMLEIQATMATHKVTINQNIWDVALQLYGTIEGAFDLLISNPKLNMTTELTPGMELEYHDFFVINKDIVSSLISENIVPANSQRNVYYKATGEQLVFVCHIPSYQEFADLSVSGTGTMVVDWGDNSELESVALDGQVRRLQHYFDNKTESRKIRIYGDFSLSYLDTSKLTGNLLPVRPVTVEEFVSRANSNSLQGLFLYEQTNKLDLQGMSISDLSPIYHVNASEIDMRGVKFSSVSVLDDYLSHIVNHYDNRPGCTILLSTTPSRSGMRSIETIIGNPEWNQDTKWKFVINDKVYTL